MNVSEDRQSDEHILREKVPASECPHEPGGAMAGKQYYLGFSQEEIKIQ